MPARASELPHSLKFWLLARGRSRGAEPWQQAFFETSHSADPVPGEGQDKEADPVTDARRVAHVGAERGLTVRARRHEVERAARAEDAGKEARGRLAALVLEGQ